MHNFTGLYPCNFATSENILGVQFVSLKEYVQIKHSHWIFSTLTEHEAMTKNARKLLSLIKNSICFLSFIRVKYCKPINYIITAKR